MTGGRQIVQPTLKQDSSLELLEAVSETGDQTLPIADSLGEEAPFLNLIDVRESTAAWVRSLAKAIRDPADLIRRLDLSVEFLASARRGAKEFGCLVPESYLARMTRGNPDDPLLRQVLPLDEEVGDDSFRDQPLVKDAVGDAAARLAPGLLQKYKGRALLITTGTCAINCRYCFRRHYPYDTEPGRFEDWDPAFDAIAEDDTLSEVILSGGDPLILSDRRLQQFFDRVAAIPHIRRLRIHSRLPIVLPDRVDNGLMTLLRSTRLTPIMVVHANHPSEIAADCQETLARLVHGGVTTLNQSVLLRGVNDSAETLIELSERLINLGVMPYYLHALDEVQGVRHFTVSEEHGHDLIAEMRRRLPGYAVPRFVREVAGEPSKSPLGL